MVRVSGTSPATRKNKTVMNKTSTKTTTTTPAKKKKPFAQTAPSLPMPGLASTTAAATDVETTDSVTDKEKGETLYEGGK